MTKEQAKKLKVNDWVWAYKVNGSEDMPPTHCQVYVAKPDITYGLIRLCAPHGKPFLAKWQIEVFMTREEAADAMRECLWRAIRDYERQNEELMDSIRDDLDYNNKQLARLHDLLDALAGKKPY